MMVVQEVGSYLLVTVGGHGHGGFVQQGFIIGILFLIILLLEHRIDL